MLLGDDAHEKIMGAHVVVVGLGAVGSYVVEGLARAGLGRLRLVDFDEIRASNINRQLFATESTIGKFKADVAEARVMDINPDCKVESLRIFVHNDTLQQVLEGEPDLVIDAIDSLNPKVELLCALLERGIPLISSMGAALRTDPTMVRIGDVFDVRGCPLAKQVRKRLRKRGFHGPVDCVYSTEIVRGRRQEESEELAGEEEAFYSRGRERKSLGSLPTLTGIFGLTIANAAIGKLTGGFDA
ncbi:MAG: tRNA threonylcarbamoyladenosine dehydratase [Planctomycetes bacterium]|nr:tRNA threonylcarbamoyladenosine dehydratase [Planctomycetota bacterium]